MRATITTWCTFKATASAMQSPSAVHPLTLKAQLAFSLLEKSYWIISYSYPSRRRLFQTALSLFCDEGIVELMLKLGTLLKVNKFSCL